MARYVAALALVGLFAPAEAEVLVMTKDNFDETIKSNKHVLVEFYAPWCGHCKKLEPEYNKASEMTDIVLGKVDATVESELGSKFGVSGYPTLKFFVDGTPMEYDGPREAAGIADWLKTMTGPAVEEFDSLSAVPKPSVKAVVTLHGSELTEKFQDLAKANRKAATWAFAKGGDGKVIIQHPEEEPIETTVDNIDMEDVKFAHFMRLDGETFGAISSRKKPMLWTLLSMEKDEMAKAVEPMRKAMTSIAKKFKNQLSVTYTDTVQFKDAIEGMLGISDFPRLCYQDQESKKKFIYDGEMTEEKMSAWLDDVRAGKVEPVLKSEPEPASNDEPVKVVTGKTLNDMVFQKEKDVLFEVYAPWCGHCKNLEPHFNKVGQKVQREKMEDILVIAKMDGTKNESPNPSIDWSGFPTLYYVKAGSSTPTKYDGPREAKGIWKWIKDNHSKKDEVASRIAANKAERAASSEKDEM